MFLLDTNVISELRKPKPHGGVIEWISPYFYEHLFLPSVVMGELQAGVEITRQQDEAKARELELWIDLLMKEFTILSMDAACFRAWARLMHRRPDHLSEDAMIASIALTHQLTVVTRNVRDFEIFEVPTLNQFSSR